MLRDPRIKRTLERSGFTMNDAIAGVALASAAVLTDRNGAIQTISPEGKPTLPTGVINLREDITNTTLLKAIPTRELRVGTAIMTKISGNYIYILRDSATSSGNDFVRPNDYDASENRRTWELMELTVRNFTASSSGQFPAGFTANGYSYIDYMSVTYTASLNVADITDANIQDLDPQNPASDVWTLPQSVDAQHLPGYGYVGYMINYSSDVQVA